MNLITFIVLTLGLYVLYKWTWKAWRKTDLQSKMMRIKNIESQHDTLKGFNKDHKNYDKKAKEVSDFVNKQKP